jgi:hypothetical protein
MWRFMWYKGLGGNGAWADWYTGLDEAAKARHDLVFDFLQDRQANKWRKPFAKTMGKGQVEITIHTRTQHRLFGFFGPQQGQFSVLVPCTHKDKVYKPKDAKETHKKRLKEAKDDPSCVTECRRPPRKA